MQDADFLKYGRYLTSLIASVILNTTPPEPFENIDWFILFKLAKKHDVAVTIYPAIKNMALPDDAMQAFTKDRNRMVARTARQNIEAERVFAELEKNSIKYIKLKGSHIKNYYPEGCIRTFGDVDLCLTPEDREKARPIMEALGYSLENAIGYHDEYKKDNFYIFELHSSVVNYTMQYAPLFDDPFSKSVSCTNNEMGYVLKNEYLYLHLICHLYNHFIKTGCGIRLFADFLVFDQKIKDIDYRFVEKQLIAYGMQDFYNTFKNLMQYFFYNKKADNKLSKVALYILKSETNGIYKNKNASLGFWSKIGYFLKNWFPSAKDLAFRYPVLNKAPILLPVCWLRRIFYSLFFKRSSFKTQVQQIKELNSQEFKDIKKARDIAINK